jgi:hypothetical protein
VYWRPEPICGPCAKTARDYFDAHGWPPDAAGTEFFLARGIVGPDETVRAHTDTSLAALAAERVAARHAAPGGS